MEPHYLHLSTLDRRTIKLFRGFAKKNNSKKAEITMEVGGWVQVSLGIFVVENRPKIALNQY